MPHERYSGFRSGWLSGILKKLRLSRGVQSWTERPIACQRPSLERSAALRSMALSLAPDRRRRRHHPDPQIQPENQRILSN